MSLGRVDGRLDCVLGQKMQVQHALQAVCTCCWGGGKQLVAMQGSHEGACMAA